MSVFVFWRDEHEVGLKGVVEVRPSDLPQDADVSELISTLYFDFLALETRDGVSREVVSILLYGEPLRPYRLLNPILAGLPGSTPRLVAVMKARPIMRTNWTIWIETLAGETSSIRCASLETISCLKLRVQNVQGISPDEQILVYNNVRLEDYYTLSECGLYNGETVSLTSQLCGGYVSSQVFADVANDSILVPKDFVTPAPRWRIAHKGLNVEGKCETPTCEAFGQCVIFPKYYEPFNLLKDKTAKCSICRKSVKPFTCGFYDCVWKFEGVKANDGLSITSRWKDASGKKYHRFQVEGKNGYAEWQSLLIVAKPRDESNAAKLVIHPPSRGVDPSNVCSICWSKFGLTALASLATARCSHSFHRSCFIKWSAWCSNKAALLNCPACHTPV